MLAKLLFHPTIFPLIFLAVFLLNSAVFHSPALGLLLLVLYVSVAGWETGRLVAGEERGPLRWWIGTVLLLGVILLLLTASYYVASIPKELVMVLVLITFPILGIATKQAKGLSLFDRFHQLWAERQHHLPRKVTAASALLILLFLFVLSLIQQNVITDPVRSVWERLDPALLLLLGLMLVLLFALFSRGKERALTLPLTSLTLFLFLGLVLLAFPLGYGFDSFIHRATESHIAEFGTITPKPLYYIGQYALVLFFHHGFELPVALVDAYLVPLLAALLLPVAWYSAAVHITGKKQLSMLTLTGLFLLPLSSFIVTTPQALSNLFTLLLILAAVPSLFEADRPRLWLCALLAACALAIHPIAGLPAMIFVALLFTHPTNAPKRLRPIAKLISVGIWLFASIMLPASFLINAAMSGQSLSLNLAGLSPLSLFSQLNIQIFFQNRFSPLLDLAYVLGRNAGWLLGVISVWAWWTYRKEISEKTRLLLGMALVLLVNFLLLSKVINFTFLINYERANYAARLIPLVLFFLTPFFLLGLSHLFLNLRSRPLILRACTLLLLTGWALSNFYLSYPRQDAYETSHALNTSQSDIEAVHLIETWAEEEPYLVLANQSVSAAAISEIGFRYYDDLFFYPIPTGDVLYQSFLNMNETPTRETAQAALDLVPMHGDVFTLFYVVNTYWWQSDRLIETAKTTADDWRAVDGVSIFRYDFPESSPSK